MTVLNETTDGRIRLTHCIVDPKEIRKVAKGLKLSHLIHQVHKTIHHWADQQPDSAHLATARDVYADTGLCIGTVYCPNGMMTDFALLFDTRNCFENLLPESPSDEELEGIFDDLRKVKLKMMVRLVNSGVLQPNRIV